MLKIEEEDFILMQLNDSSNFFDLYLKKKKKKKQVDDPDSEIKTEVDAYGITMPLALKKIVNYRISLRHENEAMTMREYIDEYKNEVEKLENLLN